MKLLVCVTGTTGSGKSTLLDSLAMRGWKTLFTGAIFRQMKKEVTDKDTSYIAPESFDEVVYDEINKFLYNAEHGSGPCLCAIEAFPRKPEQIKQLVKVGQREGWIVICLALNACGKVRRARVSSRDMCQPDRWELDKKKMTQEDETWGSFLTVLKECGVPTWEVDTTNSHRTLNDMDPTMGHIMDLVAGYYNHRSGKALGNSVVSSMIKGIICEAEEATEAETSEQIVEELIDVLWYTMCAFVSMGVQPKDINQMLNNKASVNFHRLSTGHKPHVYKLGEK